MFLLEPGGKRFRKTFAPPNRSSTPLRYGYFLTQLSFVKDFLIFF